MSENLVTITQEQFDELIEDSARLLSLQSAGVDNWSGYEYAIEEFDDCLEAIKNRYKPKD